MTDTPTAKVETKTQYVRAVLEKEIGSARAFVVLQAVYEEAAAELERAQSDELDWMRGSSDRWVASYDRVSAELESVRADRDRLAVATGRIEAVLCSDQPGRVRIRIALDILAAFCSPEEGSNEALKPKPPAVPSVTDTWTEPAHQSQRLGSGVDPLQRKGSNDE